jgi:hypothetical protein
MLRYGFDGSHEAIPRVGAELDIIGLSAGLSDFIASPPNMWDWRRGCQKQIRRAACVLSIERACNRRQRNHRHGQQHRIGAIWDHNPEAVVWQC